MDGARKPNLKRRLSGESHSPSKRPTTCSIKPTDPATKPRASFNDLPEELISQIISYLSIEEFKHDDAQSTPQQRKHDLEHGLLLREHERQLRVASLVNLCRVSTKTRRITEPFLYECPPNLYPRGRRCRFLRTVAARPDLAARVRYVAYQQDRIEEPQRIRDPEVLAVYLQSVRHVRMRNKRLFLTALYSGECDAEWALLFAFLANVETVRLGVPGPWDKNLRWTLSLLEHSVKEYSTSGTRGPFCALRSFGVFGFVEVDISPPLFYHLMKLPSLKELNLQAPFFKDALQLPTSVKRQSKVEILQCTEADLNPYFVAYLLDVCEGLKSFSFEWADVWIEESVDIVNIHLGAHRSTLEHVELSLGDNIAIWEHVVDVRCKVPCLGPFNSFTNLKSLRIDGIFLTGVPGDLDWNERDRTEPITLKDLDYAKLADTFPESLEELEIHCEGLAIDEEVLWEGLPGRDDRPLKRDVTYLVPFLQGLARNCLAGKLPKLAILRLCAEYSVEQGHFAAVEHLMASANVKVELRECVEEEDGGDKEDEEDEEGSDGHNPEKEANNVTKVDTMQLQPNRASSSALPPQRHVSVDSLNPLSQPPSNLIDRFPDKILAGIFSHFDLFVFLCTPSAVDEYSLQAEQKQSEITRSRMFSLRQLCLVSKRFHSIARPLLYKTFLDLTKLGWALPLRRRKFIDYVTSDAEAAAYVKGIQLISSPLVDTPDTEYINLLTKARLLQVDSAYARSCWLASFENQKESRDDHEIPLLLSQTQNLETLHLFDGWDPFLMTFKWTLWYLEQLSDRIRKLGSSASSEHLPLSKLRQVSIDMTSQPYSLGELPGVIGDVLHFPSMRSFSIFYHRRGDLVRDMLYLEHLCQSEFAYSNVEELVLDVVGSGPDFLRYILRACKRVKSFRYVFSTSDVSFGREGVRGLVDIVGYHRTSIENLAILGSGGGHEHAPIGSLKGFFRLKHVALAANYLASQAEYGSFRYTKVDILPPSVQTFVIGCAQGVSGMLGSWLVIFIDLVRQGHLPNLRSVTLKNLRSFRQGFLEHSIFDLGPAFLKIGVAFILNGWDTAGFSKDIGRIPDTDLESDSDGSIASEEHSDFDDDDIINSLGGGIVGFNTSWDDSEEDNSDKGDSEEDDFDKR